MDGRREHECGSEAGSEDGLGGGMKGQTEKSMDEGVTMGGAE